MRLWTVSFVDDQYHPLLLIATYALDFCYGLIIRLLNLARSSELIPAFFLVISFVHTFISRFRTFYPWEGY
jgi:hypothetical protein